PPENRAFLGGYGMNWTLPTWVVIYPTTPTNAVNFPKGARKWVVVGKDKWILYELISEAISESQLPSKEVNRLRPTFIAVKGRYLDCPGPSRSV
ncbi:hypothetical protein AVEN_219101-1, partial [Araneus ventricosus]